MRRFSLDAISEAETLESKAKDVATRTLEAEMDAGHGIFAGAKPRWAKLRFDVQSAQWVSREEWHPEQKGSWDREGRYELEVPFVDEGELAMDVLRHGGTVEVLAPPSLRSEVARRHRAALTLNDLP